MVSDEIRYQTTFFVSANSLLHSKCRPFADVAFSSASESLLYCPTSTPTPSPAGRARPPTPSPKQLRKEADMTTSGENLRKIEALLREAYSETHEMFNDPELSSVVNDGLTISYGPPIYKPDLLLLSFQGAGDDKTVYKEWPKRLLYADTKSPHRFGKVLRKLCRDTGLHTTLETSTMAFPAVFPQAKKSTHWNSEKEPYAVWRRHSVKWVERLVGVIEPKVVMVFGKETSKAFGISWDKVERNDKQNWPTFGVSQFQSVPAVYCCHLSRRGVKAGRKSFEYTERLVSKRK